MKQYSINLLTFFLMMLSGCDYAYELKYTVTNSTGDSVFITYSYPKYGDSTVVILPNESRVFLEHFIIRKATSFGDCCPCKFELIEVNDTAISITNPSKWVIKKSNEGDGEHKYGFVNCEFSI